MNVSVPDDLCEAITVVAKRNRISTEEAIRQAIHWFVKEDDQFWKDVKAWDKVSAEALALVERLADEGEKK